MRFRLSTFLILGLCSWLGHADDTVHYGIFESSESIYKDQQRRRLKNHPHIRIGLEGNGWYNLGLINSLENWDVFSEVKASPLAASQIDQFLFVCRRGDGNLATITRLFLPTFEESRKGGKDRAELPCGSGSFSIKLDAAIIANVLDQMIRNPNALIGKFDQVREACPSGQETSAACKTARNIAARAIALETRGSEPPPVLTVGSIQVAVGLNRPAPVITGTTRKTSTSLMRPKKGDLIGSQAWAAQRRNAMLSACGWRACTAQSGLKACEPDPILSSLPDTPQTIQGLQGVMDSLKQKTKVTQEMVDLMNSQRKLADAIPSLSVFHPAGRDKKACDEQRKAYREYFRGRGFEIDKFGKITFNGKLYTLSYDGDPESDELASFIHSERQYVERLDAESVFKDQIDETQWNRGQRSLGQKTQATPTEWNEAFAPIQANWVGQQLSPNGGIGTDSCLELNCRQLGTTLEGRLRDAIRDYRKSVGKVYCVRIIDLRIDAQGKVTPEFGPCEPEFQNPPDEQSRINWEGLPAEQAY